MKQYPVYYEARYWDDSDKIDRFTCGFIFAETLTEAGRWAEEYFEDLITVAFTPLMMALCALTTNSPIRF